MIGKKSDNAASIGPGVLRDIVIPASRGEVVAARRGRFAGGFGDSESGICQSTLLF